jgi:hypothetical protein
MDKSEQLADLLVQAKELHKNSSEKLELARQDVLSLEEAKESAAAIIENVTAMMKKHEI